MRLTSAPGSLTHSNSTQRSITLTEALFLLSLITIFLPLKVYPFFFLTSSVLFVWESRPIHLEKWPIALAIYIIYGLAIFGLTYSGQTLELGNAAKLVVNTLFLISAVHWLKKRDNSQLTRLLDWTMAFLLLLSLGQLLIYHGSFDYRLIFGSNTSGQASSLYRPALYYWGLDDKNMFGARIALLGFVFVFIPVLRNQKLSVLRILFVFLIAFLSLSRTPMVALLLGIFALSWMILKRRWRIALVLALAIALPYFLSQVVRIDSITSSNDGMGIRIVYWTAFFNHFTELSPLGGGFLEARDFLQQNAKFYRGEPHIHNTFMTTYVEFGLVGLLSFSAFIVLFFQACYEEVRQVGQWIILFLPIVAIMMILYSGYDNDVVVYFTLIWLVGTQTKIDFQHIKIKVL
jgi:O-antigen ligase